MATTNANSGDSRQEEVGVASRAISNTSFECARCCLQFVCLAVSIHLRASLDAARSRTDELTSHLLFSPVRNFLIAFGVSPARLLHQGRSTREANEIDPQPR